MSMREEFESKMAGEAMLDWDDGMQEYRSVVTQKMWVTWQAARATDAEPVGAVNFDGGIDWFVRSPSAGTEVYTHPPAGGQGVPEGYVLAPKSMCITQKDVGLIVMMTGWDDEDQDDAEGVLWFGLIEDDDGNRTHGLNISCAECMEEGAIQLVQFDEPSTSPGNGWVLMPEELTAENGAKNLLMGEFEEVVELGCGACDEDDEDCEVCGGNGSYTYRVPVSWTTIKAIYKLAAEKLKRPEPPTGEPK